MIYYGDELGMGDNVFLGDRNGVRTPMQWSGDRNAGFSGPTPRGSMSRLSPTRSMGFRRSMSRRRSGCRPRSGVDASHHPCPKALPRVRTRIARVLERRQPHGTGVCPHVCDEVLLCVVNLSRFVQPSQLDLSAYDGWQPIELIGETPFPPIGELPYFLTFGPHSFYWFRLERPPRRRMSSPSASQSEEADATAVKSLLGRSVPGRCRTGWRLVAGLPTRPRHQRGDDRGRPRRARRVGLARAGGGARHVRRWRHGSLFLAPGVDRVSRSREPITGVASGAVTGVIVDATEKPWFGGWLLDQFAGAPN